MGGTVLWDRRQIHTCHIGPFVAQQLGHPQAGIEGTHAAVDQLLVGPGGVAVPETVVGHGAGGVCVLDFGADLIDVLRWGLRGSFHLCP